MHRPIVLSSASPSELVSCVLDQHPYPTTLLVGWPKQSFLSALVEDVEQQQKKQQRHRPHDASLAPEQPPAQTEEHPLLRAPSLGQVAVSRHVRMLFVPAVSHLRALLTTFSVAESTVPPPPSSSSSLRNQQSPALLLAYGLVDLHKDSSEWSAQGLSFSLACLVQAAARNNLQAAVVEPRRSDDARADLRQMLAEDVPVLSGSTRRSDGTWVGPMVPISHVLGRWFELAGSCSENKTAQPSSLHQDTANKEFCSESKDYDSGGDETDHGKQGEDGPE